MKSDAARRYSLPKIGTLGPRKKQERIAEPPAPPEPAAPVRTAADMKALNEKADKVMVSMLGAKRDPQTLWRKAHRRIILANRTACAEFNKKVRDGLIAKEDAPGIYQVRVRRKALKNAVLAAVVATKTGEEFEVTHTSLGQHTLMWKEAITAPDGTVLPPGLLNPYIYPLMHFGKEAVERASAKPKENDEDNNTKVQLPPELVKPTEKQIRAIKWLLLRLSDDPQRVFYRRDTSGAYLLHGVSWRVAHRLHVGAAARSPLVALLPTVATPLVVAAPPLFVPLS